LDSIEWLLRLLAKLKWYEGHYGTDEENIEEIEQEYQELVSSIWRAENDN